MAKPDSKAEAVRKETPAKGASRAEERPREYRSLDDFRDIQTVEGKDPDKVYKWFLADNDGGHRLLLAQRAGWDMVDASKEKLQIGDEFVKSSTKWGSIYCMPADRRGESGYQYLMSMPRWAYEMVKDEEQRRIDEREAALWRQFEDDDTFYEGSDHDMNREAQFKKGPNSRPDF